MGRSTGSLTAAKVAALKEPGDYCERRYKGLGAYLREKGYASALEQPCLNSTSITERRCNEIIVDCISSGSTFSDGI
jgi:hypothetical protein